MGLFDIFKKSKKNTNEINAEKTHVKLEGKSRDYPGMNRADQFMRKYFKSSIELVKYWGPVQMCVFYLEYEYMPLHYKIIIECERGFIVITVKNTNGEIFSPWMIYPEADRYHFEDKPEDVEQLVKLTHRAIAKQKITFYSSTTDLETLRKEISKKK